MLGINDIGYGSGEECVEQAFVDHTGFQGLGLDVINGSNDL